MLNALNIKKIVYGTLFVFMAIYFLSAYFAPVDAATLVKYSISEMQLRLLTMSILLPVVVIWVCTAYGFVHFKQYAFAIKGSPQGKGTNTIANGLGIIALQLLVTGSFSVVTSIPTVKTALGGEGAVQIVSADLAIIFALAAGLVLFQGASQLNASLPKPSKPKVVSTSFYVLALLGVVFLVAIVFGYSGHSTDTSVYEYLPLSAALLSIGVPYIIAWHFYLMTVKNLRHYGKRIKGKVYKHSLGLLTNGIFLILGGSVLIQFLNTIGSVFNNLSLMPLLAILYILLFVIGLGFLFIARAATKLRNIES